MIWREQFQISTETLKHFKLMFPSAASIIQDMLVIQQSRFHQNPSKLKERAWQNLACNTPVQPVTVLRLRFPQRWSQGAIGLLPSGHIQNSKERLRKFTKVTPRRERVTPGSSLTAETSVVFSRVLLPQARCPAKNFRRWNQEGFRVIELWSCTQSSTDLRKWICTV